MISKTQPTRPSHAPLKSGGAHSLLHATHRITVDSVVEPSRRQRRRSGFSLIELVAALVITGIITAGLGSAMLLASHALPDSGSLFSTVVTAADAMDQVATDLAYAVTVTERQSTAITFTVADRDCPPKITGCQPETIRYAWSGVIGDPLTRQYNNGLAADLIKNVQEFQLQYDLLTTVVNTPGTTVNTPLVLLVDVPLAPKGTVQALLPISTNTWFGQYFNVDPTLLPLGATRWKVDQISFQMMVAPVMADGITTAQLRQATGGLPTTMVYEQSLINESTLSSMTWAKVVFTVNNSPWLGPTQGVCLVLKPAAGTDTGYVLNESTTVPAGIVSLLATADAGATWSSDSARALTGFKVFGTVTTQSAGATSNVYNLMGARVVLRTGTEVESRIETGVQVLNTPQVVGP